MFVNRCQGNLVNARKKDVTSCLYLSSLWRTYGYAKGQSTPERTFAHKRLRDCIAIFENESPVKRTKEALLSQGQERLGQVALGI